LGSWIASHSHMTFGSTSAVRSCDQRGFCVTLCSRHKLDFERYNSQVNALRSQKLPYIDDPMPLIAGSGSILSSSIFRSPQCGTLVKGPLFG